MNTSVNVSSAGMDETPNLRLQALDVDTGSPPQLIEDSIIAVPDGFLDSIITSPLVLLPPSSMPRQEDPDSDLTGADGSLSTVRPSSSPTRQVPRVRNSLAVTPLPVVSPQIAEDDAHRTSPRASFAPSCPPPNTLSHRSRMRGRMSRRSMPVTYFGDALSRRQARLSLSPSKLKSKPASLDCFEDGNKAAHTQSVTARHPRFDGAAAPSSLPTDSDAYPGPLDTFSEPEDDEPDDESRDWRAEAHIRTHRRLRRDSLDFARARRRTLDPSMFLHHNSDQDDASVRLRPSGPRRSAPFYGSVTRRFSLYPGIHTDVPEPASNFGTGEEQESSTDSGSTGELNTESGETSTATVKALASFEAQTGAGAHSAHIGSSPHATGNFSMLESVVAWFQSPSVSDRTYRPRLPPDRSTN